MQEFLRKSAVMTGIALPFLIVKEGYVFPGKFTLVYLAIAIPIACILLRPLKIRKRIFSVLSIVGLIGTLHFSPLTDRQHFFTTASQLRVGMSINEAEAIMREYPVTRPPLYPQEIYKPIRPLSQTINNSIYYVRLEENGDISGDFVAVTLEDGKIVSLQNCID